MAPSKARMSAAAIAARREAFREKATGQWGEQPHSPPAAQLQPVGHDAQEPEPASSRAGVVRQAARTVMGHDPGLGAVFEQRVERLREGGFVPAGAMPTPFDPTTTRQRDAWWVASYAQAEQNPDGGVEILPDDYTPGMRSGRSLSGHRRTHRYRYSGNGIELRMPSRTTANRFADELSGRTFDMPVESTFPGGSFHGYVRVTRGPGNTWEVSALGTDNPEHAVYVSESVRAVLESRRPRSALTDARDLLARHRERYAKAGIRTDVQPKHASSAMRFLGHNPVTGEMFVRLQHDGGKAYDYGFAGVTAKEFANIGRARSPMGAFNAMVKGRKQRFRIDSCTQCHRVYNVDRGHICYRGHDRGDGTISLSRVEILKALTGTE